MLRNLKRLFLGRELTPRERYEQAFAQLEQGWTLEAFQALTTAAQDGLAEAQYALGRHYERAIGVVQNLDDALRWYERAAMQGHLPAQARAGLMLLAGPPASAARRGPGRPVGGAEQHAVSTLSALSGEGPSAFQQDFERAAHWNRLAAQAGDAGAQLRLGLQHAKGLGVAQELDAARHWLTQSADQQDVGGMTALGVLDSGLYGGQPDHGAALAWLSRAAASGHADAQYWLGVVLQKARSAGSGAQPAPADDPHQAGRWLLKAAEQGHVQAMYQLGLAYWSGQDAPHDLSLAETWLRRAATREHVDAMRALAQMELEQPDHDGVDAASLLWQAAECGDAPSAALLGELYLQGRGVPRDAVEAARWLASAGTHARAGAMTALAGLQAHGTDEVTGHGAARDWLERAAAAGDLAATFTLGSLHHRGMGVARDDGLAARWYLQAAERGSAVAAFYLGMLHADAASPAHDDRLALRWLREAAQRGYALAVCNWASLVMQGRGQPADPTFAESILLRAVARGNLEATTQLAQWLLDGMHLPIDRARAHALLAPAVAMGNPLAAAMMVPLYLLHGWPADPARLLELLGQATTGLPRIGGQGQRWRGQALQALAQLTEATAGADDEAAQAQVRRLYEKAAECGMAEAQFWMAQCLRQGPAFTTDAQARALSARWLKASALQGNVQALVTASADAPDDPAAAAPEAGTNALFGAWVAASMSGSAVAQRELGRRYLMGQGCERDPAQAVRWLSRAAQQGDTQGQVLLARCHADGLGGPQDPAQARYWWSRAAAAGDQEAMAHIDQATRSASPTPAPEPTRWQLRSRYLDSGFTASVELMGATLARVPDVQGRQWADRWCTSDIQRPRAGRQVSLPPVKAWQIAHATVSAEFVVHRGDELFLDCSILTHQHRAANRHEIAAQLATLAAGCHDGHDTTWLGERVMVMHNEGGDTWGHFLIQNLPRVLLFLERFPDGKVALPEAHLAHLDTPGPAQLLRLLGLPPDRLIALQPRRSYAFREVVLMDFLYEFRQHALYPQGLDLLRRALSSAREDLHLRTGPVPPATATFIPRRPLEVGRQITNLGDLDAVLQTRSVSQVPMGDLSVEQQIEAWARGGLKVSTLGSDLSAMIFAPPGSAVLALTPDWFGDDFFFRLAQVCGIRWFEIRCGRLTMQAPIRHRSGFAVDPGLLSEALDAIQAGASEVRRAPSPPAGLPGSR